MIIDFIKSEVFLIIIAVMNLLLLILFILNAVRLKKINNKYNSFMKKIGKGNNIDEMLRQYINKVEEIELKNKEIIKYYHKLDEDMSTCLQKVGMVRYSAFKDTGSDLSFALAILDENNDGVILNGIYSRELSNIYAKQVTKGQAVNKLSDEEKQALDIALSKVKEYKIKE